MNKAIYIAKCKYTSNVYILWINELGYCQWTKANADEKPMQLINKTFSVYAALDRKKEYKICKITTLARIYYGINKNDTEI